MKINFLKSAFAILAGLVAVVSCSKPAPVPPPEPEFPSSKVTKTVAAGESVNINISPNMAWEVSLSGEGVGNEFWINDEGMKRTKVSGKEGGSVVVTVQFADDEKFDVNRVCEVNLSMGGQSKTIAVLTLPSLGRTFELYVKSAGETGFSEQFGSEKVAEASLATFPGEVTYTLPVRVVTNYNWTLSAPEWLTAVIVDGDKKETSLTSGNAGTSEFLFKAKLSSDVVKGAESVVKFIDANNTDASFSLKMKLPAFQDRIEHVLNTTFIFNAAGYVQNLNGDFIENSVANFELLATGATAVKVVEWNDESKTHAKSFADWATVTRNLYSEYTETDVLAKYSVEVAVSPNTTYNERFADVFVIPASKADQPLDNWFDAGTGNLKTEFSQYAVGRISQIGLEKDYIALSENPEDVYLADFVKYTEVPWWAEKLGTTNLFELVYKDALSDAVLVFSKPFASYKVFDYENIEVPAASLSDFWLRLNPFAQNSKGRVVMEPSKFSVSGAEFPESFIVFYDSAGKVLGAVSCRHSSKGTSVEPDSSIRLEYGTAEVARLGAEDQMYMYLNGNFNVTEIYKVTTKDKMLNFNCSLDFTGCIMIDPATMQEVKSSPISIDPSLPSLYVYTDGSSTKSEIVFLFQTADKVNVAALYVVYDPSISIAVPSPFEFVNPDQVKGLAVLGSYKGDLMEKILADQWGLPAEKVFELKYLDASASSVATITVPGTPFDNCAWNSINPNTGNPIPNYWLTHEMTGSSKMTVYMAEAGKVDWFVFYSGGLPTYVLVCTLEPAQ